MRATQAIAETEGVDGVLFGVADLFASMGYRGQPSHLRCKKLSWTASPPCAPQAEPQVCWRWTRRCWRGDLARGLHRRRLGSRAGTKGPGLFDPEEVCKRLGPVLR